MIGDDPGRGVSIRAKLRGEIEQALEQFVGMAHTAPLRVLVRMALDTILDRYYYVGALRERVQTVCDDTINPACDVYRLRGVMVYESRLNVAFRSSAGQLMGIDDLLEKLIPTRGVGY